MTDSPWEGLGDFGGPPYRSTVDPDWEMRRTGGTPRFEIHNTRTGDTKRLSHDFDRNTFLDIAEAYIRALTHGDPDSARWPPPASD